MTSCLLQCSYFVNDLLLKRQFEEAYSICNQTVPSLYPVNFMLCRVLLLCLFILAVSAWDAGVLPGFFPMRHVSRIWAVAISG